MSADVADSAVLPAANPDVPLKAVRKYASKLFAEIAVRIVAFGIDMVLVLFAIIVARDHLGLALHGAAGNIAWAVLLAVYFAACWASPLRASLAQLLCGMRVLNESGGALSPGNAIVRAAALVGQWWLVTVLFDLHLLPDSLTGVVVAAALMFVPVVTRHRQGVHDLVARSIVINRRAQRSQTAREKMLDFLAADNPESLHARRPSIPRMLGDTLGIAVPVILMAIALPIAKQKDMYARVAYAITQTGEMQRAVESHYYFEDRWPNNETELGMPLRHAYPDGGFFMLEDNGVIRIQFEVKPELKHGSLLLAPQVINDGIEWRCRIDGAIEERFVLNLCRSRE